MSNGRRFATLARYLAHTREGEPTRAAWIVGRNLPDDDPLLAAKVMQANAAANARVRDPVYHVAIAFDPADHVTRRDMERAADRVLRDVGLADHQALVVAHADRAHPHVHVMINRVHPETGRAWDRAHDYRRLELTLRAIERESGLRVVPGRHAPVPDVAVRVPARDDARLHEPDDAALAFASADPRTRGERRREMRTDEVALVARAAALRGVFAASASWDDLTAQLQAAGIRLERRGQGLVITDGHTAVKASRVARACAMTRLEARFGVRYDTWQAGRDQGAERTITDGVRPQRRPTAEERFMATSIAPTTDELTDRSTPRRNATLAELADSGRAAAYADRALGDPHRVNPDLARPLAEQSAGARHVAARVGQYEAVLQAAMTATEARETLGRARDVALDGVHQTRVAQGAERDLESALAKVYRDPVAVRREIDTAIRQVGLDKTADMILRTPTVFGEVTAKLQAVPVDHRLGRQPLQPETMHAVRQLDRAEQTRAEAPTPEQMNRLRQSAERAEVAAVNATAALAAMPNADALARGIARGVARLDDRAFAELKATLPVARAELIETFRESATQALARDSAGRVQHLREQLGVRGTGESGTNSGRVEHAAAIHERAARSLTEGRELARVLAPREHARPDGLDTGATPTRAPGVARDPASTTAAQISANLCALPEP